MNWDNLTLSEKSELMKLYLKNGITSLSAIKEHYNNFQSGGKINTASQVQPDLTPIDLQRMYSNNTKYGNRYIDTTMLRQIDDYMITKGVGLPQRQAIAYTVQQEGNTIGSHGNGASGLVGWRGPRATNLPKTTKGQAAKLYNEVYGEFNADNWNHGGKGSGYNSGRAAQQAFKDAKTVEEATKAFNYGYVRPPVEDRQTRTKTSSKMFKSNGGELGIITSLGQWKYPGKITTIPSNNITMKWVNYPVLGVSNTGDVKYMLPNFDYLFKGNYVTEYPINHSYQLGSELNFRRNNQVLMGPPPIDVSLNTENINYNGKKDSFPNINYIADYVGFIENRDSIGFDPVTRTWGKPDKPGYDLYNVGQGLDRRTNPYLTDVERNLNHRISEERERNIKVQTIRNLKKFYDDRISFAEKTVEGFDGNLPNYKQGLIYQALYKNGAKFANWWTKENAKKFIDGTDEEATELIKSFHKENFIKTYKGRNKAIDAALKR